MKIVEKLRKKTRAFVIVGALMALLSLVIHNYVLRLTNDYQLATSLRMIVIIPLYIGYRRFVLNEELRENQRRYGFLRAEAIMITWVALALGLSTIAKVTLEPVAVSALDHQYGRVVASVVPAAFDYAVGPVVSGITLLLAGSLIMVGPMIRKWFILEKCIIKEGPQLPYLADRLTMILSSRMPDNVVVRKLDGESAYDRAAVVDLERRAFVNDERIPAGEEEGDSFWSDPYRGIPHRQNIQYLGVFLGDVLCYFVAVFELQQHWDFIAHNPKDQPVFDGWKRICESSEDMHVFIIRKLLGAPEASYRQVLGKTNAGRALLGGCLAYLALASSNGYLYMTRGQPATVRMIEKYMTVAFGGGILLNENDGSDNQGARSLVVQVDTLQGLIPKLRFILGFAKFVHWR